MKNSHMGTKHTTAMTMPGGILKHMQKTCSTTTHKKRNQNIFQGNPQWTVYWNNFLENNKLFLYYVLLCILLMCLSNKNGPTIPVLNIVPPSFYLSPALWCIYSCCQNLKLVQLLLSQEWHGPKVSNKKLKIWIWQHTRTHPINLQPLFMVCEAMNERS